VEERPDEAGSSRQSHRFLLFSLELRIVWHSNGRGSVATNIHATARATHTSIRFSITIVGTAIPSEGFRGFPHYLQLYGGMLPSDIQADCFTLLHLSNCDSHDDAANKITGDDVDRA
jgi:hypothetical protein